MGCQTEERILHILAVFRGREDIRAAERVGRPRDTLDGFDPACEDREGLASRQVGHRKDPLRAVEERVAEQLSKPDMPDDVPDRHVDVDLRVPLWYVEPPRLLFDLS